VYFCVGQVFVVGYESVKPDFRVNVKVSFCVLLCFFVPLAAEREEEKRVFRQFCVSSIKPIKADFSGTCAWKTSPDLSLFNAVSN
jgi:hypothetical protein